MSAVEVRFLHGLLDPCATPWIASTGQRPLQGVSQIDLPRHRCPASMSVIPARATTAVPATVLYADRRITTPRLGSHSSQLTEDQLVTSLPVWCKCGNIVTFSNETRCEECYSADQQRFSGKSQHVETPHLSARQEAEHEQRTDEIKAIFEGGISNVRALQTAPRPEGRAPR